MKYNLTTAISIVIANMVGTGVFTSLGFQLFDLNNLYSIALLWIVGGFIALLGSYCYAELSAAFPRSGGEYHFLRISLGKTMGFLSGWTSAVAGFAAPIAASSIAFATYFSTVVDTGLSITAIAFILLLALTVVHSLHVSVGANFQVFFTIGKVLLLIFFIVVGLYHSYQNEFSVTDLDVSMNWSDLISSGFWVSLIYVSYAYSGWNASVYIIDDIKNPIRNVPKSIFIGTITVIVLYVLINLVFLFSAPASALRGKADVAHESALYIFGNTGASIVSGMISFFLISTIGSMIIVGPRVIKRISDDYSEFSILAKESKNGVPFRAILLQTVIAGLLILTSSLSFIITSIGFILSVFTTLTAVALIYLRYKHPQAERKIKVPFYPITPLLFIVFNLWTMAYLIINKPEEALTGVGFVLAGLLFYFIIKNTQSMKKKGISAMLLIVSFISCTSNENGETKNNTVSDTASIAKTDSNSVRFNANPELDKRAAQIAGMDTGWIKANETKKAVSKLDNSWKEKKTAILNPIRTWVENNQYYPTAIQQQCLVFYPFSGPDFEFVNAFYPEADTYILCGLEKAGNDQSLLFSKETALDSFIKMAENYFYFSDKMGFFRTIDMKQQFARRGVVDIIALYIKRAGAEIGEVSLSVWDKNTGELVPPTAGSVPDVCSFVFRYPSGNVSTLHYFSKDLSDGGLQQDARWLPWVTKQASGRPIVSLTKSASYLMHTSEFSQVRSYILQNSITHIQDDTGISYDDMLKTGKKVILHGEYTTVIPVFKHYYQKTMAERYRSDSVQRLPFKIGYNLSHSEASLQVLQK